VTDFFSVIVCAFVRLRFSNVDKLEQSSIRCSLCFHCYCCSCLRMRIEHLIGGIAMSHKDYEARLTRGVAVFDDLYEYFRRTG
jgi:hypothetical protein